ncbi:MAG: ATP-binding protein [Gammaproteobacteria bacterium]
MKRISTYLFIAALAVVGVALYLLSLSTGHSMAFGQWHLWLLVANVVVGLLLIVIILINLARLVYALRRKRAGARLTARLIALFTALAVLPVGAVFYFSVMFINHSIDSWFDLSVARALSDALSLSRQALASETGPYAGASTQAAGMLADRGPEPLAPALLRLRGELGATTLAVFDGTGTLLASSVADPQHAELPAPKAGLAAQLAANGPRVELYSPGAHSLYVQAFAPLAVAGGAPQIFEALFPVSGHESVLARRVEVAYGRYRELNYLRQPLKLSFTLTLSLVLLLSLLAAVWAAFFAAQRMVAPVRQLVHATRAVARGDFGVKVPEQGRDEISDLARSFNSMTRGLTDAREQASRGQQALEHERVWLASVLGALSTGVVTVDGSRHLRSINAAAADLLDIEAGRWIGRALEKLLEARPEFVPLLAPDSVSAAVPYEFRVHLVAGERTLRAAFTELRDEPRAPPVGTVFLFEDVTDFILAQRDAAWGEVARRLAHEIKNPLMPIRLAAERLRMKCLPALAGREAEILDRATATVIAQVEAMQTMVDAFSEYAKSPPLHLARVDLAVLVRETAELYRGRADLALGVEATPGLEPIMADAARLRQILHNLIKNAIEAQEGMPARSRVRIQVASRPSDSATVALRVQDAGPGFEPDVLAHGFEPYATRKHRGMGLGLALVRKLAEEQGGHVALANVPGGGAQVTVTLPRSVQPPGAVKGGDT